MTTPTSTSVTVQWLEPDIPNGEITMYTVSISDTDAINQSNSTTETEVVIEGLTPFTTYTVLVYGFTSAGRGDPEVTMFDTEEAGVTCWCAFISARELFW